MQRPQGAATPLPRPGEELTRDSSQQGLLLPLAVPPAGKFSTRSIGGSGAGFPRLPDFTGAASRETGGGRQGKSWKALHRAGGGGAVILTWGTRNKKRRGARRACSGSAAGGPERVFPARALGRRQSPRPGPGRRCRFLPRARHVTAIKHVCVRFAAVTS